MSDSQPPWLHLMVVFFAAFALWVIWNTRSVPPGDEGAAGHEASDAGGRGADEEPTLTTRERAPAAPIDADGDDVPPHPEDWILVVESILTPTGAPAAEASVFLDLPDLRGGERSVTQATYTWTGRPLRIRLRRAGAGPDVEGARAELPPYWPDTPICVSVYAFGYARWFAEPLSCPADRRSALSVHLAAPRPLAGTVKDQDGAPLRRGEGAVTMRIPGVPREAYERQVETGEGGRFTFGDGDDLPRGAVLLRAASEVPRRDGWSVEQTVARGASEAVLALRVAHHFGFRVRFAEDPAAGPFASRRVRFRALDPEPDQEALLARGFPVTTGSSDPLDEDAGAVMRGPLLPEGPPQRWVVEVPGYRPAYATLDPSGPRREHVETLRMEPDPSSGLLVLAVAVPPGGGAWTRVHVFAGERPEPAIEDAWWGEVRTEGDHVRIALRVPSGVRHRLRFSVDRQRGGPWVVARRDVTVATGETLDVEAAVVRGGLVRLMAGQGRLLRRGMVLRLTQGDQAILLDPAERKAARLTAEVTPGPWRVEVLRDGRPIPWSSRFELGAGDLHQLRLPADDVLFAGVADPPK